MENFKWRSNKQISNYNWNDQYKLSNFEKIWGSISYIYLYLDLSLDKYDIGNH